jgi:hypothetical protein
MKDVDLVKKVFYEIEYTKTGDLGLFAALYGCITNFLQVRYEL